MNPSEPSQVTDCGAVEVAPESPRLESHGARLVSAIGAATDVVILVAPFVKVVALRRLISGLRDDVPLVLVTRWRPEEVAAGVSDLEVLDLLGERGATQVRLHSYLHAKYFRVDHTCFVGSANITGAALGWASVVNLELLIDLKMPRAELLALEREAIRSSVPATAELQASVREAAELLRSSLTRRFQLAENGIFHKEMDESGVGPPVRDLVWFPHTRNPENLYLAYVNRDAELTIDAQAQTAADLAILRPPTGLSRSEFDATVRALLLQERGIAAIDEYVEVPRRFGAIKDRLNLILRDADSNRDPVETWQTLMRWLLHFFPRRYGLETPRHSEIFCKKRT